MEAYMDNALVIIPDMGMAGDFHAMPDPGIYICKICGHAAFAGEMLWDNVAVPTCPTCWETDMLFPIKEVIK